MLYFVSPQVAGFGLRRLALRTGSSLADSKGRLRAEPPTLEGPHYRLKVDEKTGGVSSLVHKPSGTELLAAGSRRTLCQSVYFTDKEHLLENVRVEAVAAGPVLACLRVAGKIGNIEVTSLVTVYAELDHVDFDVRVHKPPTTQKQRLCQVFPVLRGGAVLRIETPGAVIRPERQPAGDLLPGADTRRFAVQGFVDASVPGGLGVTVAPLEAFALRTDLEPLTFEALGNDQNYREVVQDQDGIRDFRWRYALRAHGGGYDGAGVIPWSRQAATPLLAAAGSLAPAPKAATDIAVDPSRALATCLKPADGEASKGVVLRLWEVAGRSGPLRIGVKGYGQAVRTDLLERDRQALKIVAGGVEVDLSGHGFAAVRLLP